MSNLLQLPGKQIQFSTAGVLRDRLGGVGTAEGAVALLLAAALWLPPVAGGTAWPLALALLLALAGYRIVCERRLPPVPALLIAYVAVYALVAVYGGTLTPTDAARYFLRPLTAVAVATVVVTARQRRRVLVLVVLFAATEIFFAAGQTVKTITTYGRGAVSADSVTGTLGAGQAGVLTLVAMVAATLVAGGWLAGALHTRHAAVAATALITIGVFSATRAIIPFVVVVAVAMAAAGLTFGRERPAARRLLALVAASIVAAPLLYGATIAIYPGAFVGAISSQNADILGGAAAQGIHPPPAASTGTTTARPAAERQPAPRGVELLPGRFVQLRLAFDLSLHDGIETGLLGRGPGAAVLDPSYQLAQDVPLPQRTGSTWIGLILTETGWLGFAAFIALLGWLALLGRTLWRQAEARSADRAFGVALPGVAALTAVGGAFATILDVRGYSIVFWLLVGVAISAAYPGRSLRRPAHAEAAR